MDVILQGYMDTFADANGLSDLAASEKFEIFTSSVLLRKRHQCEPRDIHESAIVVGGGNDGGIDAVAILVNGRPVTSRETVDYFLETRQYLNVEFVFLQAKRTPAFVAKDIDNFIFGVKQFCSSALGGKSHISFNDAITNLIDLSRQLYANLQWVRPTPRCVLYYVTTGTWKNELVPTGRLDAGKGDLLEKKMFSQIDIIPVDSETLKIMYGELERGVVKEVLFDMNAPFPEIGGVDEAYVGLLAGDQFIRLVSTEDGQLNRELFYDNVRDFQGQNNVNSEIGHTLSEEGLRNTFPLLNNGVTIVAEEVRRTANRFTISDFQIVNGCQTTHMIYENRDSVGRDTYIPIKLVVTQDRQIVNNVIRATNQQTTVLPEALESLTPFHRNLENFYHARNKDRNYSDYLYYERRSKQYAMDKNIKPKNIISLTTQIWSFVGMFLNEPHSCHRYYGELLRAYEGRMFVEDHKSEPYYASGAALAMLERRLNLPHVDRVFRSYRYHLLMVLRVRISGYDFPALNSGGIVRYSNKIVDALRSDGESLFEEAERLLGESLDRFRTERREQLRREGNTPDRLRAFTDSC